MQILQAVIFFNLHSRSATSSKIVWLLRNYDKVVSCHAIFERKLSEKAINHFTEGRSQVSLSLQWDAKNFSLSEREKTYKYAVENLKNALNLETDKMSYSVSNKNMESIISQALESQDLAIVTEKLDWCLESNKYPSFNILKALATLSVESKNAQCVSTIRNVVKAGYPPKYTQHAQLLLYAVEVSWRNGDLTNALMFLMKLFKECPFARPHGRFMLSRIIAEAITCHVEPAVTLLINFSQNLIDHEEDYFPMTIIWYYLFTSKWFSNQKIAGELVEKNENLKSRLSYLVEHVAQKLLYSHQNQDVLRLLEFLLRHKLHSQYATVQQRLFNYHYHRRDVKACTEIYKSSVAIDLPLSETQRDLYMKLVLQLDDCAFQKPYEPKSIKLTF